MTAPRLIRWQHDDLVCHLVARSGEAVQFLSLGPLRRPTAPPGVPLVEVSADGEGRVASSPNALHRLYAASARLRYVRHEEITDRATADLAVTQEDPNGLRVVTWLRYRRGAAVIQAWSEVYNNGGAPVRLRYVSTLPLTGLVRRGDGGGFAAMRLHVPYNAWAAEFRWQELTLEQAGLVDAALTWGCDSTRGRFSVSSTGSWSSGDYLPMGGVSDRETGHAWVWQIEHNGAWQWEAGDVGGDLSIRLSGPTDAEHQWDRVLEPGTSFTTVPAALAFSVGGFTGAIAELTAYRRMLRRPHQDTENLPVIFNDYMNCLMGGSTTEKLLPLVEAAGEVGCEYFVLDAGWYSDTDGWWDAVGQWEPSRTRFPEGLSKVMAVIREHGMIPGLWIEPEVVGVRSPAADELPEEAFFCRDGKRLIENGRYQLDYRHPAVIGKMDKTIDGLIADFGVGYFKFDYNINIGPGTDVSSGSPGDGLLGHNRAFSAWLDGILRRHPGLVLENCASGGMRTDYAQLQRMTIQSTSDQQDPLQYVPIACAAPTAVTPEQSAVWAYPQPGYPPELNALTLISAMLGRIHLSGRIDLLDQGQIHQVRTAVQVYQGIRRTLKNGTAFWPLGLPGWHDSWSALGIETPDEFLLAIWYRGEAPARKRIPLSSGFQELEVLFPSAAPEITRSENGSAVDVSFPHGPAARLIRLRRKDCEEW